MKIRKYLSPAVAVIVLLALAGVAYAFAVGNVDGVWGYIDGVTETNGGSSQGATCSRWATGAGDGATSVSDWNTGIQGTGGTDENQVRYGEGDTTSDCDNDNSWAGFASQSGFGFDGVNSVGTVTADVPFYLGRFTHYNNPISADNQFDQVGLSVTVSGIKCNDGTTVPTEGGSLTFTYNFELDETSNSPPCAYSPVIPADNYCPDRVTVGGTAPSASFHCPEGEYTVQVLGFMPPSGAGTCPGAAPGTVSAFFVTQERADNNACLWASITAFSPTAVELSSFTATGEKKSVRLAWTTASEVDNVGFNLYRATSVDGERTKLNAELIPTGAYPGSPSGATYSYTDTDVRLGRTYTYWLEDVDISGKTGLHGPVEARLAGGLLPPIKEPPIKPDVEERPAEGQTR